MIPYIKVYSDFISVLRELDNGARGRLFLAIMQYANGEEPGDLTGAEKIAFVVMKGQIDRDAAAYEDYANKQRENGKKGGRPPKATAFSENPKNPKVIFENPKNLNKEKDKEKDKEFITPHTPQGGTDDLFDRFWKAYPKKVGKGEARKAFGKLKPTEKLTDQLVIAVGEQKLSEQWRRDNGRFIPNPATWLNQGRWGDELTPAVCQEVSFDLAAAFRMMEENSNGSR